MTHVQSIWTSAEVYPKLDDVKPGDVQKLKEWCKKQQSTVPQNLSDEQLILFLHSCYNNQEDTKRCMTEYYSLRRKAVQFFGHRDFMHEDLQKAIKTLNFGILKESNPENFKIVYHGLNNTDPSNYSFNDGFKLLLLAMDSIYIREGPVPGLILLFDMAGVKMGHVARLPIGSVKRCLEYIQDANPVRLKAIHVINVHPVIDKIMILVRPFMRKHLMSLLHFHKEGDDSIYEVIPKSCMPSNYGGELDSVEKLHEQFVAEMKDLRPLFVEEDRNLADAFRVSKSKTIEKDIDLSKLDID